LQLSLSSTHSLFMKLGSQSLVLAGFLGLILLLTVSAAPITNDLDLRAEAFADLGARAGGIWEDEMK